MATGKTLQQVVAMTAFECRFTTDESLTLDMRETLKHFCRTEQSRLVDEFDWPEFKGTDGAAWFDLQLVEGQRFYDYPTGCDPDKVTGVHVKFGNVWIPLLYGITPDDYTSFNSDDDVRVDPAIKWARRAANRGGTAGLGSQVEIWPIPSSGATDSLARFASSQTIDEAVSESQIMVIDDLAIMHFAASRYWEGLEDGGPQALKCYARGQQRLTTLKVRKSKNRARLNYANLHARPHPLDPRYRVLVAR